MRSGEAFAKINLGLVVGHVRPDGRHEVVTLLQRIGLSDTIEIAVDDEIAVDGFEDTIVRAALEAFRAETGLNRGWHVTIGKRIPVAAGLGGGSSDVASALRLANELSGLPLGDGALHVLAAQVGADVPFFLRAGAQVATGDGSTLAPRDLPAGIPVVLVLPYGERKMSTAAVYDAFDARGGAAGFESRRDDMLLAVEQITTIADLAALPGNDLASSPLAEELLRRGAVRAEVSGAGPAVYGLFSDERAAAHAADALEKHGRTWATETVPGTQPWPWRPGRPPRMANWPGSNGTRLHGARFSLGRGQVVRQRVLVP